MTERTKIWGVSMVMIVGIMTQMLFAVGFMIP
jgi:hypothetical protein